MELEKGDHAVLEDKHSEFDGQVGEITQVSETMFGDKNYTISFEGGQETGVPGDALEPAEEDEVTDEDADEAADEDVEDAEEPADEA